jgi:hypothetical protein
LDLYIVSPFIQDVRSFGKRKAECLP